jgi:von Willebrand factor type A domain/Aerotolerance regulator N-terminal
MSVGSLVSFLAPGWLWFGVLGALVLILHARRRRTLEIPSIQLWRPLESGARLRQRLRLPLPNVLLSLQLAVVALISLALARPVIGPRFAHEIVVLDASGEMRMTDVAPSRFDAAVAQLAAMAAGPAKESGARISVILAGARPQVVAARLTDPARLGPLFAGLRAGDGDVNWTDVDAIISTVLKDHEPTRLVVLTDRDGAAGAARFAEAFPGLSVETRVVGGGIARNAALRATLRAVDAGTGKWRAEGTVAFSSSYTRPATVSALVQPEGSDGFLEWGSIEVKPATAGTGEAAFALDLDLRGPSAVVLQLPDDDGPADNAVQFVVRAKPRALKILQLGADNAALARALKAAAEVELYAADRVPSDVSTFDLVVANGVEIAGHPATNMLWLGSAHESGEAPGVPRRIAEPVLWTNDHPALRSVSWTTVSAGRAYRFPRMAAAAALAEADGVTLIEARSTPFGREVRIAFDLDGSNWPEQPSFPVFVANLIHWIAPDVGTTIDPSCQIATTCTFDPRLFGGEASLVATAPASLIGAVDLQHATAMALPAVPRGTGLLPRGYDGQFMPDRAGLYRITQNGLTRFVAVNIPESDRRAVAPRGSPSAVPSVSTVNSSVTAWWWLTAAAFVLLAIEGWLAGRGAERFLQFESLARGNPLASRRRTLLALRTAALIAAALALAGLPLLIPDQTSNVVVVTGSDFKAEAGTTKLSDRSAWAGRNIARGVANLGIVAIGAQSRIIRDIGEGVRDARTAVSSAPAVPRTSAAAASPPSTETGAAADLESALVTAAAMLGSDTPGHIVVAFDGNETRGNAARALPQIVRRGLKVDVLPVSEPTGSEVLVESLTAPERIYAGDSFPLQAVVYSQKPTMAMARIIKDGELVTERPVELVRGQSRIETDIPAAAAGRAHYEVNIVAPDDVYAQNNRGSVIVDVLPPPQVLIVAAQPAWAEIFAKALALHEIRSTIVEPKRAPYYLKDWLAYSAIVLMNVPAIDLVTLQQELIEKAVAEHGRGLLLLGGENSFGPGGYYETPLERVSPLSSRVPREAPRVALAFVLDRSGSMQRNEGGATRLDIAKQATVSAIRLLHPDSLISIVAFDSEAKLLMPLGPAKDSAAVAKALGELEPGGGTALYPGLVEALHQLDGVDAMAKHMVVMSDGLTQPGDFPGILKAISAQGISVSTVSIGEGADGAMLADIARMGRGAFHSTRDFKALPGILSQEALLLSGKPVEERPATPRWVDRTTEFFAGLPDRMPTLNGYVLTTRKPQADLHLVVNDAKQEPVPLLASWHYGNGRVVALTTQGAGAWTQSWEDMAEYPLLWSQTLRHLFPGVGEPIIPRLTQHGDDVDVDVEMLNPEGAPREGLTVMASLARVAAAGPATQMAPDAQTSLALAEVAPGQYHGHFLLDGPGDFVVRATADQATAEVPLSVAYPARYRFTRADPDRLAALATATGGRVLANEEQVLAGGAWRLVARNLWQVWVVLALALFMAELVIRYASGLIGRRRARRSEPSAAPAQRAA